MKTYKSLYELKRQGDLVTDSRGMPLAAGDTVVYIVLYSATFGPRIQLCQVAQEATGKFNIVCSEGGFFFESTYGSYIINLKNFDTQLYTTMYQNICTAWSAHMSSMPNYTSLHDLNDIVEKLHRLQNNDIRNLKIRDMLGRALKPGDYVCYKLNKEGDLHIGIVVSDKAVLTDKFVKQTVKHVLLIPREVMTQLDIENYKELTTFYNNSVKHKSTDKTMDVGTIFIDKQYKYVYLGNIELDWVAKDYVKTTTYIDYKVDKDKQYWFKFDSVSDDVDADDVVRILTNRLYSQCISTIDYKNLKGNLYGLVFKVTGFKCLVTEVPKNIKYLKNVNLGKEIIITKPADSKIVMDKCNLEAYQGRIRFK